MRWKRSLGTSATRHATTAKLTQLRVAKLPGGLLQKRRCQSQSAVVVDARVCVRQEPHVAMQLTRDRRASKSHAGFAASAWPINRASRRFRGSRGANYQGGPKYHADKAVAAVVPRDLGVWGAHDPVSGRASDQFVSDRSCRLWPLGFITSTTALHRMSVPGCPSPEQEEARLGSPSGRARLHALETAQVPCDRPGITQGRGPRSRRRRLRRALSVTAGSASCWAHGRVSEKLREMRYAVLRVQQDYQRPGESHPGGRVDVWLPAFGAYACAPERYADIFKKESSNHPYASFSKRFAQQCLAGRNIRRPVRPGNRLAPLLGCGIQLCLRPAVAFAGTGAQAGSRGLRRPTGLRWSPVRRHRRQAHPRVVRLLGCGVRR